MPPSNIPDHLFGGSSKGFDPEEFLKLHKDRKRYNWDENARENQKPPAIDWTYWLILAGRGFGKTRVGAEMVRKWVKDFSIVNIIGATADDARDIMVEGESGILTICPEEEKPEYHPSKRQLEWPNGAKTLIFTADEPERLRGKQSQKLWCDELAAWRRPETFDQAKFGLRLGSNPQAIITTTPRPIKVLKDLIVDEGTVVTRGSTYDNRANLAPSFFRTVIKRYEGTRIGRQELNAEMMEDVEGALWGSKMIDDLRVQKVPEMSRIVVSIDPAVTSGEDSDETGIIVVGRGTDGHGYILEDLSCRVTSNEWGRRAVHAYKRWKADRIIAEVNQGGDLVENVIRTVDPNISYKTVRATRGKTVRAEPVSSLYEQGRVHHVGFFPELETQMCAFVPDNLEGSPDRADAMIWGITELALAEGHLGVIEFLKSESAAEDTMKQKKEAIATGDQTVRCPQCGSMAVTQMFGNQGKRCSNCGNQFGRPESAFGPPKTRIRSAEDAERTLRLPHSVP